MGFQHLKNKNKFFHEHRRDLVVVVGVVSTVLTTFRNSILIFLFIALELMYKIMFPQQVCVLQHFQQLLGYYGCCGGVSDETAEWRQSPRF